jgi:NADH-quinone oxidoreductase subunit J
MDSPVYTYMFYAVAFFTALSAFGVVVLRNVVHAAFSLFFSLFSVAIIYVFLSADFIAAIQLIVYVGGILILILFGILFTTDIYKIEIKSKWINLASALLIAIPVIAAGVMLIKTTPWNLRREVEFKPSAENLGNLLLGKYLLPFEIISIVLLMVMVGAIVLVRKEIRGKR